MAMRRSSMRGSSGSSRIRPLPSVEVDPSPSVHLQNSVQLPMGREEFFRRLEERRHEMMRVMTGSRRNSVRSDESRPASGQVQARAHEWRNNLDVLDLPFDDELADRPASVLDFNMLDDEENDMEVQLLERPAREASQAREQSAAREVEQKKDKEEEFDPVLEELRKKQTIVEHYDGKFDCSICLGVVFQPVQSSACRHIFCSFCLYQSLENSDNCPTCQKHVRRVVQAPVMLTNLLDEYVQMEPEAKLSDAEIEERNRKVVELKQNFERRVKMGIRAPQQQRQAQGIIFMPPPRDISQALGRAREHAEQINRIIQDERAWRRNVMNNGGANGNAAADGQAAQDQDQAQRRRLRDLPPPGLAYVLGMNEAIDLEYLQRLRDAIRQPQPARADRAADRQGRIIQAPPPFIVPNPVAQVAQPIPPMPNAAIDISSDSDNEAEARAAFPRRHRVLPARSIDLIQIDGFGPARNAPSPRAVNQPVPANPISVLVPLPPTPPRSRQQLQRRGRSASPPYVILTRAQRRRQEEEARAAAAATRSANSASGSSRRSRPRLGRNDGNNDRGQQQAQ
ncbi:hypothetical protein WR25_08081 isoform A [Diploscapter pachys]|uniref:RING-type domain-containing protein n=1 Tax=Diploscapter pachys TaxID=2018661 RepID=A0A2A2J4P5_9BILA|nr:hypothetical protein WR25_08081 isoform A [Diploscapter pachys]